MELGKTLMDAVTAKQGWTRYRIAKELKASEGFLSRVYNGKDPIPPGMAARMAVLAGIDARRAALEALVSHEKDYAKQVDLADALGLPRPVPPSNEGGLLQQIPSKLRKVTNAARSLFKGSARNGFHMLAP